ncbi:MAG: type 4a pilus biogenesis protein PilO [Planctomycetes bacterium]|nr:type 4a pilus biogenesis protein PilO [Planctomycetota bacterium]
MRFGLRELIFVMVLLAVPVAAWWFVFKPNNLQIAQAREEIRAKQQKLQQLQAATRQMEDLGHEIDKLTEAIDVFEAKLPAEKEVEVMLKEVWQLAAKHGLKPRSVRAEKPIKSSRYSELPLKMVITGNFDGYYAFLLDLERLSRITRVPEMKLEKLKNGDEGQMEAQFTLSIFFEPQDANPTTPKA